MALRDDVLDVLNKLREGTGVTADDDGDIAVRLTDRRIWVRIFDKPEAQPALYVYASIAEEVPLSPDVSEFVNDTTRACNVFRLFWAEDAIFLRADLIATPFVPAQLQCILEDFEGVASEIAPEAQEWSIS